MPRADDDTWDLARSVGATATGVAVGRALASQGPSALIDDPYAAPLVRAVGVDFFTRLVDGKLDPCQVDGDALFGMRLLDNVTALSAPGGGFAAENMGGGGDAAEMMQNRMHQAIDRWREHGFDVDMTDLWYFGERNDVAEYLSSRGWRTVLTHITDLYAANGLTFHVDDTDAPVFTSFTYVTATRSRPDVANHRPLVTFEFC
jgi:O-methyltransferase involved in polyketide biosynthesis